MKAKLLSVAVVLLALWAVPSAFADSGGSGGFQAGAQSASTMAGRDSHLPLDRR